MLCNFQDNQGMFMCHWEFEFSEFPRNSPEGERSGLLGKGNWICKPEIPYMYVKLQQFPFPFHVHIMGEVWFWFFMKGLGELLDTCTVFMKLTGSHNIIITFTVYICQLRKLNGHFLLYSRVYPKTEPYSIYHWNSAKLVIVELTVSDKYIITMNVCKLGYIVYSLTKNRSTNHTEH